MKMSLGLFPFDLDCKSKLYLRSEVLVGLLPCICGHGCFSGCCGKVPLWHLVLSGLSFIGLVVDCQGRLVTGCRVGFVLHQMHSESLDAWWHFGEIS